MPFIHIRSLPLAPDLEVSALVENLCADFAKDTGIDIQHVTVTWECLEPGSYAVAGKACATQQSSYHPVMVDLLSPDSNSAETIAKMLRAVASSIAGRTGIPFENIFINHRQAKSGMVFDAGKIVQW